MKTSNASVSVILILINADYMTFTKSDWKDDTAFVFCSDI